MKNLLPKLLTALKVVLENDIADNFKTQSFDGKAWPKRKSKTRSDRRNPTRNRALLVQGGHLRRSIKVRLQGQEGVRATSDFVYAPVHNEGAVINHPGGTPYIIKGKKSRRASLANLGKNVAVFLKKDGNYPKGVKFTKPHPIPVPQRRYVGDSARLRRNAKARLFSVTKQALREELAKKKK